MGKTRREVIQEATLIAGLGSLPIAVVADATGPKEDKRGQVDNLGAGVVFGGAGALLTASAVLGHLPKK